MLPVVCLYTLKLYCFFPRHRKGDCSVYSTKQVRASLLHEVQHVQCRARYFLFSLTQYEYKWRWQMVITTVIVILITEFLEISLYISIIVFIIYYLISLIKVGSGKLILCVNDHTASWLVVVVAHLKFWPHLFYVLNFDLGFYFLNFLYQSFLIICLSVCYLIVSSCIGDRFKSNV